MPYFRDNDNQPCGFTDPHPQRLFLAALARHERSADLACLKQFRAETPHFSTGHLERLPGLLPVQALVFGRLRRSLESGGFGFNVSNKSKFRGFLDRKSVWTVLRKGCHGYLWIRALACDQDRERHLQDQLDQTSGDHRSRLVMRRIFHRPLLAQNGGHLEPELLDNHRMDPWNNRIIWFHPSSATV